MRLIELEAAIKTACYAVEHYPSDWAVIEAAMRALPVVEERKHGHWVTGENEDDGDFIIKCSICGKRAPTDGDYRYYLSNYCPYCGAVMDEVMK